VGFDTGQCPHIEQECRRQLAQSRIGGWQDSLNCSREHLKSAAGGCQHILYCHLSVLILDVCRIMKPSASVIAAGVILICTAMGLWSAETKPTPSGLISDGSTIGMEGSNVSPTQKASPFFEGSGLPQPPQQGAAWSLPTTTLPTNYLTAAALLFQQGMADPRGCEYREIEVGTGSIWRGDGGVVKTRGWVLPGQDEQRFAVCWNGLVYPVVSMGTNVDLESDARNLVTNSFGFRRSAMAESGSVLLQPLRGIQGCFLLRLGKVELATELWLAQARAIPSLRGGSTGQFLRETNAPTTNDLRFPDIDPFLSWAGDWTWALFDRMICAHMRGDQKLALADARDLIAVQPKVEEACASRGSKREPVYGSQKPGSRPYLEFLGQLPEVLADLERREKEGARSEFDTRKSTNVIDQIQRIKALVRDLDQVQARQWAQPGGVHLAGDGVVAALIAEGDAAVEPLLDCLENDKRLTRSVSFGRDFHRGRTVESVHHVAWVALQTILQAGFSTPSEMRAYWAKYKGLKLEERWYAILKDDAARSRWQEAAANIVQPENVTRFPGGFSTEKPGPTNAPVRLRGDLLRDERTPSVTGLLTRHALEVPTNNIGAYDLSACCQLAGYLGQWDLQAALPVAKTLTKRASTVMKYSGEQLGGNLTSLSIVRGKAGDASAFDDYAEWIVTTSPKQFEMSNLECLEPFRRFPTNAHLRAASEELFGQTNSPWSRLPWKSSFGKPGIDSELIELPGYRSLLCRELQKTNACGTISLQLPGQVRYSITNLNQAGVIEIILPADSSATNGSTAAIRWGDWIALTLAKSRHIAPIDPFAPPAQRDHAILSAVSTLQEPGK